MYIYQEQSLHTNRVYRSSFPENRNTALVNDSFYPFTQTLQGPRQAVKSLADSAGVHHHDVRGGRLGVLLNALKHGRQLRALLDLRQELIHLWAFVCKKIVFKSNVCLYA